jgi:hypothetical protein
MLRVPAVRPDSVLWTISVLALIGFAVSLGRLPIDSGDGPFYASIARSLQLRGVGIPSVLKDGPTAVDHVQFYGPVFFYLTASWFSWFGFSSVAYRELSLLGAILIAFGGAAVCSALGGGRDRQAWSCVLLLLSPELGLMATFGRMDTLAVGFEMLGLAIFLHGLTHQRAPWLHGLGSAVLFGAAALTTPRSFPFMLGFAVAAVAILPSVLPEARRHVLAQLSICVATGLGIVVAWTFVSAGGPRRWLHMMSFIASHEDTDVAILPTMVRQLTFVWWQGVTFVFATIGAFVAAHHLRGRASYTVAASFALVTAWTTLVVTMTLFNFTFLFGTYSVLPLFAIVIAVPTPMSDIRRRGAARLAVALLLCFAVVRTGKLVRAGVTWSARNPARLERFIEVNIPPGSEVMGPLQDYFFAVERNGSRYLAAQQVSAADWARWIPVIEQRPPPGPTRRITAQYLLWPADESRYAIPSSIACARGAMIAVYQPPPDDLPALSWLVKDDPQSGYPLTFLYPLKQRCEGD